jgi:hypothetical protein
MTTSGWNPLVPGGVDMPSTNPGEQRTTSMRPNLDEPLQRIEIYGGSEGFPCP